MPPHGSRVVPPSDPRPKPLNAADLRAWVQRLGGLVVGADQMLCVVDHMITEGEHARALLTRLGDLAFVSDGYLQTHSMFSAPTTSTPRPSSEPTT